MVVEDESWSLCAKSIGGLSRRRALLRLHAAQILRQICVIAGGERARQIGQFALENEGNRCIEPGNDPPKL
jgi:hypothetical protein